MYKTSSIKINTLLIFLFLILLYSKAQSIYTDKKINYFFKSCLRSYKSPHKYLTFSSLTCQSDLIKIEGKNKSTHVSDSLFSILYLQKRFVQLEDSLTRYKILVDKAKSPINYSLFYTYKALWAYKQYKLRESDIYFSKALTYSLDCGYNKNIIICYNGMANIHFVHGNFGKSLFLYHKALDMILNHESLNNEIVSKRSILNNISTIYYESGYYEDAEKILDLCVTDSFMLVKTHIIYAQIHTRKGNISIARKHVDKAKLLLKNRNENPNIPEIYRTEGLINLKSFQYNKAKNKLDSALYFSKVYKDYFTLANTYCNLMKLHKTIGNEEIAIMIAHKCLALTDTMQLYMQLKNCTHILSGYYHKKNKYKKAFIYLNFYNEANKKIFIFNNLENIQKIKYKDKISGRLGLSKENSGNKNEIKNERIRLIFSLLALFISIFILILIQRIYKEKQNINKKLKIQNIVITRQKNDLEEVNQKLEGHYRLIEEKNKKLLEASTVKDIFFSIIAHDMKNPFNVIIGMSSLLIYRWENYPKNKIISILSKIQKVSKSNYYMLEHLLEWSRIQMQIIKPEPSACNLSEIITKAILEQQENIASKYIFLNKKLSLSFIHADQNMLTRAIKNLIKQVLNISINRSHVFIEVKNINDKYDALFINSLNIDSSKTNLAILNEIDKIGDSLNTLKEAPIDLELLICKEYIHLNKGKIVIHQDDHKLSIDIVLPKSAEKGTDILYASTRNF